MRAGRGTRALGRVCNALGRICNQYRLQYQTDNRALCVGPRESHSVLPMAMRELSDHF